jgi:hypothetical protein
MTAGAGRVPAAAGRRGVRMRREDRPDLCGGAGVGAGAAAAGSPPVGAHHQLAVASPGRPQAPGACARVRGIVAELPGAMPARRSSEVGGSAAALSRRGLL